jgi:hypothetical protein
MALWGSHGPRCQVRTDSRNQVRQAWLQGGDGLAHGPRCQRPETALVVPVRLPQPVPFAVIRTRLAILAPVRGRLGWPAWLAVAWVGPVIGISGPLGPLPRRCPGALAHRVGAETWGLAPGLRPNMTATRGTSTGAVDGSLLSAAINLAKPLQQAAEERQPK